MLLILRQVQSFLHRNQRSKKLKSPENHLRFVVPDTTKFSEKKKLILNRKGGRSTSRYRLRLHLISVVNSVLARRDLLFGLSLNSQTRDSPVAVNKGLMAPFGLPTELWLRNNDEMAAVASRSNDEDFLVSCERIHGVEEVEEVVTGKPWWLALEADRSQTEPNLSTDFTDLVVNLW